MIQFIQFHLLAGLERETNQTAQGQALDGEQIVPSLRIVAYDRSTAGELAPFWLRYVAWN
jgi:hypothetical protein